MSTTKVYLAVTLVCWTLALADGSFASPGVVKIGLKKGERKSDNFFSKSLRNRNLPLINDHDNFYYGEVFMGTPPQKVLLDFDTGSSDMFVSSVKMCDNPKYREFCEKHNMYDNRKSKTYKKDGRSFTFSYGSLVLDGFSSKDSFEICGLNVTGQMFLEMTDILEGHTVVDGIFGLAYPALSVLKHDPPFNQMVKQGLVKHAIFSFYLNDIHDSCEVPENMHDAELVFGGTDPNHYTGDITYAPVIEKLFWKIKFQNVSFGSDKLVDSIPAVIDSGTTLIYGPTKLVQVINNNIGGHYTKDGTFKVDCSKKEEDLPIFSFTISGKQFELTAKDYIFKANETCISAFNAGDMEDGSFLMGDILMRRYYTVFDMENNQVGFATAK